jgi:hypothetical protein
MIHKYHFAAITMSLFESGKLAGLGPIRLVGKRCHG